MELGSLTESDILHFGLTDPVQAIKNMVIHCVNSSRLRKKKK